MRKAIGIVVALVLGFAVLRRFGPALRDRAMVKCQEMLDRMPEESPPKRMMRSIEAIQEQNSRILRDLEAEPTALADAPGGR